MIAVIARTTPKTYASLAGGFGAMCPLPARQMDVAMPDFGGANRERCVSYVTLRRLSKKCKRVRAMLGSKKHQTSGQGPSAPPSRGISVSLLTEHDGLIHFDEHLLDHRLRQSVPLQCLIIECLERHQHFELCERCLPKVLV